MGWITNGFISQSLRERQQFTGLANFTSINKRESVSNSYHSLLNFLRLLDFIGSQIIMLFYHFKCYWQHSTNKLDTVS